MTRYLKYSSSLFFACLLSGCVLNQSQKPAPVEQGNGTTTPPLSHHPEQKTPTIQNPPPITAPTTQPQPVPEVPKTTSIDWAATLQPLVANMEHTKGIPAGSVLLVDRIKNSTNGSIQTDNANSALNQALSGSTFSLVTADQLAQAKKTLGISPNDSLNSRGKAIGLARNLNAQYVLYTTTRGDVRAARVQMQLMLVSTGEIIWTGSAKASY
ncbi:penicillin-binding protein activator LpoB [Rosenbergiella australiborealis]|uniref:Penicillin-binding protein activator LpoB n=1 Tax=Rosenbergiella australiborealis TaxID=1544696 RepID=A0ABS5T2M3_9GAMM|nr:penicillin-binding protein activator LpoB [Rosenbergiella australiborealis]MBT0726605.1 penicillin-binding protein activator LpoB [Rosenbergiella australiborealis]